MTEIATAICLIPIPDHPLYLSEDFEQQRELFGITVDEIVETLFQDLACDRPDTSARHQAYENFINHLKLTHSELMEEAGGYAFSLDHDAVLRLKLRYEMIWDQVQLHFQSIIVDLERTMSIVSIEGFTRLSPDTYCFTLGYLARA